MLQLLVVCQFRMVHVLHCAVPALMQATETVRVDWARHNRADSRLHRRHTCTTTITITCIFTVAKLTFQPSCRPWWAPKAPLARSIFTCTRPLRAPVHRPVRETTVGVNALGSDMMRIFTFTVFTRFFFCSLLQWTHHATGAS